MPAGTMKRRPFEEAGRSVNSIAGYQLSPFNDRARATSNMRIADLIIFGFAAGFCRPFRYFLRSSRIGRAYFRIGSMITESNASMIAVPRPSMSEPEYTRRSRASRISSETDQSHATPARPPSQFHSPSASDRYRSGTHRQRRLYAGCLNPEASIVVYAVHVSQPAQLAIGRTH